MASSKLNLARARVLISNDDGIEAPGLKALEKVMRGLTREVWVIVPETEQSATGHSLTLRRPLRIRKVSKRKHAIDGTPTDSVLLGVTEAITAGYFSTEYKDVVAFGLLILILLFRPSGILGRPEVEKV